jgi:hypothetical protein
MATTFTLKRKYFAESDDKKSVAGKVLAGAALAGTVALGAKGAGGMKALTSKMGNAYSGAIKGGGNMLSGIGAAAKSGGRSVMKGGKELIGGLKPAAVAGA